LRGSAAFDPNGKALLVIGFARRHSENADQSGPSKGLPIFAVCFWGAWAVQSEKNRANMEKLVEMDRGGQDSSHCRPAPSGWRQTDDA